MRECSPFLSTPQVSSLDRKSPPKHAKYCSAVLVPDKSLLVHDKSLRGVLQLEKAGEMDNDFMVADVMAGLLNYDNYTDMFTIHGNHEYTEELPDMPSTHYPYTKKAQPT